MLLVFQNLKWNNNKLTLYYKVLSLLQNLYLFSDLPRTGPAIYGLRSVYAVGEFVNLTCEAKDGNGKTIFIHTEIVKL